MRSQFEIIIEISKSQKIPFFEIKKLRYLNLRLRLRLRSNPSNNSKISQRFLIRLLYSCSAWPNLGFYRSLFSFYRWSEFEGGVRRYSYPRPQGYSQKRLTKNRPFVGFWGYIPRSKSKIFIGFEFPCHKSLRTQKIRQFEAIFEKLNS